MTFDSNGEKMTFDSNEDCQVLQKARFPVGNMKPGRHSPHTKLLCKVLVRMAKTCRPESDFPDIKLDFWKVLVHVSFLHYRGAVEEGRAGGSR